ncbi:MAG TPA: hypothetical protein VMV49_15590 [Candidatus Deferrimicrobium sp.]|nr:hypothetical protein [Candidatus Deferrimicrobium sp.]
MENQSCFISFTYKGDTGKGYSKSFLNEAPFINTMPKRWRWANSQYKRGKIIRVYEYNPSRMRPFKRLKYPLKRWPNLKCNFPATDYPFGFVNGDSKWFEQSCQKLKQKLKQ